MVTKGGITMTFESAIARIRRAIMLDPAAFEEARDDAPFTVFAAGAAALAVFLAAIGAWLWAETVLNVTPNGWFVDTMFIGTILTLVLFAGGIAAIYLMLTRVLPGTRIKQSRMPLFSNSSTNAVLLSALALGLGAVIPGSAAAVPYGPPAGAPAGLTGANPGHGGSPPGLRDKPPPGQRGHSTGYRGLPSFVLGRPIDVLPASSAVGAAGEERPPMPEAGLAEGYPLNLDPPIFL